MEILQSCQYEQKVLQEMDNSARNFYLHAYTEKEIPCFPHYSLLFFSFLLSPIKPVLIIQLLFSSHFYLQFKEMPKELRKYSLPCPTQPSGHEDLNSFKNVKFPSKIYKLSSHQYILGQNQLKASILSIIERGGSPLLDSQF